MPLFATLTFDARGVQPTLTAVITNAVLEGGDPFALTVRSSSGFQLVDGTSRFMGDYLHDIYPAGTQYLFDWKFSTSTNGDVVWNGTTAWAGGHAWYLTFSNVTLVPAAWLDIERVGSGRVQITWAANLADYILESAAGLPALNWTAVTNTATPVESRLFVTLGPGISNRFYRLRKP